MEIVEDGAYIMFTSTVYKFHGFTLMLMQKHNEVPCQSHGTGIARIPGWGEEPSWVRGHIVDDIFVFVFH